MVQVDKRRTGRSRGVNNVIKTYRKKPIEFKAVQWTGENLKER